MWNGSCVSWTSGTCRSAPANSNQRYEILRIERRRKGVEGGRVGAQIRERGHGGGGEGERERWGGRERASWIYIRPERVVEKKTTHQQCYDPVAGPGGGGGRRFTPPPPQGFLLLVSLKIAMYLPFGDPESKNSWIRPCDLNL